jgi:hypothetical protein
MKQIMRIALGLALVAGTLVSAQSPPRTLGPAFMGATVYCSLKDKGPMGVGWTEKREGKSYRCLEIFDENLKPAGAYWVEVEPDGRSLRDRPR